MFNYRVVDLTTDEASICGKVFADLGAEVIKLEEPEGDKTRSRSPFFHDEPHLERSLFWFAYNTGKKSITLNIDTREGQEIFRKLVQSAHFLVESFTPGYISKLHLGYEEISKINSQIIMASVTGFGQDGPYSQFKAPDIVCMAMGGEMNLCGDPDRAPLRLSAPQAYLHAGVEAAVGMLIAHWHRLNTGEGQYVDVSAQECIAWEGFHNQVFWNLNRINITRQGSWRPFGPYRIRMLFPCRDGFIMLYFIGGIAFSKGQRALVQWMDEEGKATELLRGFDWDEFDAAGYSEEMANRLLPPIVDFIKTKTKQEMLEFALHKGLVCAPISSVKDIIESPQLAARNYWERTYHPDLNEALAYPGAPCKSTEPLWQVTQRAPLLGEHNEEIYGQLGLSQEEIATLKDKGII